VLLQWLTQAEPRPQAHPAHSTATAPGPDGGGHDASRSRQYLSAGQQGKDRQQSESLTKEKSCAFTLKALVGKLEAATTAANTSNSVFCFFLKACAARHSRVEGALVDVPRVPDALAAPSREAEGPEVAHETLV
jgi:hypothetical protein